MFSSSEVQSNGGQNGQNNKLVDMTLTELQEIAIKQQQQIEINQQLLLAKEKRLKILKLEEQRNQQLTMLSQNSLINSNQLLNQSGNTKCAENSNKLENLKQNVLGQELKIFKLKELRNQILKHKLSNSNMSSELDLIKSLFAKKERELCDAVKNVAELTKQIDQLRKIKTFSNNGSGQINSKSDFKNSQGPNGSELEKLKQELQIRNKLNEQQSKKIMQQHESFNQKQIEVLSLDKRIEELQNRISNKKILSEQLNQSYNNTQNIQKSFSNNSNFPKHEYAEEEEENIHQNQQRCNNQEDLENELSTNSNSDNNNSNQKYNQNSNNNNTGYSPSKQNAKFATKQEIANTYMNKFGSEAYQRYQMNTIKNLQQQQHRQNFNPSNIQSVNENQAMLHTTTHSELLDTNQANQFINQSQNNNQHHFLTKSSQHQSPQQSQQSTNENLINNLKGQQAQDGSTLPSHLTHEFDKIKYLPDMVKTIKKRHSISEIEGSAHHVPPLIFQRMIQNHHKNFLDQKQQKQLKQIKEQEQLSPKLGTKEKLTDEKIPNESLKIVQSEPKIASVTQITQKPIENKTIDEKQTENKEITDSVEADTLSQISIVKSTKPIIKIPNTNQNQQPHKRRVNFNPHALLLDAAVEGELDLVMKCAKMVQDVSEPNDEGITALHNSVCAGHFEIVKFLVEFGCDINFADNDGWTPLHCAASCNNLPMVKFLIEHGASVYASTVSDNETAIKKCEEDEDGFEVCYEYLNNAQENLGNPAYNNALVYTLYSYEKQNEDELSFKTDEKLIIINKNDEEENDEDCDGWWTAKSTIDNKEGLVPNNYLGLYPRTRQNKKSNQHESTIC